MRDNVQRSLDARRVIFAEGHDPRVLAVVEKLVSSTQCKAIVVGFKPEITRTLAETQLKIIPDQNLSIV